MTNVNESISNLARNSVEQFEAMFKLIHDRNPNDSEMQNFVEAVAVFSKRAAPPPVAAQPNAAAVAPPQPATVTPPQAAAVAPPPAEPPVAVAVAAPPKEPTPPPPEISPTKEEINKERSTPKQETSSDEEEVKARDVVDSENEVVAPDTVAEEEKVKTPPPAQEANSAEVVPDAVAEEDQGKTTDISTPTPPETSVTGNETVQEASSDQGGSEAVVEEAKPNDAVDSTPAEASNKGGEVAEEDKAKSADGTTPPPAAEGDAEKAPTEASAEQEQDKVKTPAPVEEDEGFPTPEYENYSDLVDVVQGEVPQELTDAVAYLNSLNTSDVDSCQKLMTADTFKYLLKAVKGIRNEDGQVEETLPYHALSILAQIHTRGLSRNERRIAENCAAEFRAADGLNVVFDLSTSSAHVPSKQLAAVLTAFTFAYEPLPDEYRDIIATLMDIVVEYDKDASSYYSPPDPRAHQAERLVALALHALTLLLSHEDNVQLILEDNIGREGPDDGGSGSGGGSQSTPPHGWRGFSSSSPLPRTLKYDPASPPTNSGSYPSDSPQSQRAVQQSGEVPDLPLSMLQEKIYELISSEDKNVSAWAIRFYAVQALHMTLNEKRAFVAETSFFDIARELVALPLNDETLPVVENINLLMYNLCLKRYDKGKSFILKTGIAKELFTNLVRVDFKALSNPVRGHIKPLEDEETLIPESLQEPLTALSPQNALFTPDEQSRFVDHQVHLMGIVEHTFAIFRSFSHNIMALEYIIKIGIATPISNILYNYNRKLTHDDQILEDAAEESYGRFLANTLELFRYLAAVGVDEIIQGKGNELRTSLEKIQAIRVLETLLQSVPWDSFDYSQELSELDYTCRGLLDLAFAYPALYAADDAPEEARPAFDFINTLRSSDSPLMSSDTPSLYVKYYNHLFQNVNNAESF